ncbi:MAG: uroporphyrinogen-III C-methyltransferase [Cellvibrionaceae bacterium]|nr:uroporphyrinogen-III C-methyltransferase [Cellvibrionaceae bacterium]
MTDNDKTAASDSPELLPHAPSDAVVTPAAEPSSVKSAPPNAHPKSSGRGTVLLLLVVLLIAVGLAVWLWQQWRQQLAQVQDVQAQIAQQSNQLAGLREQLGGQLTAALERAEARERELRQQVAELQGGQAQLSQQVEGQQQRLASLSTTSREDWLLAEAAYLLSIANQRVLMERTADNAVALLRSADECLQQVGEGTGDAAVFAIRKTLSLDLAALEKVEPVDKEGIYLRLYALAQSVDDLPRLQLAEFANDSETPAAPVDAQGESGLTDRIWRGLRNLAGSLDRYVRIDDVKAPAKPLVDSYATRLASLNVRLLLEQAQLALLQDEPTVYRHSLEQAQSLLQSYYVESEQNSRLRDALAELATMEVAPELPDISASLAQLRDHLRQLHRVQPAPKGQL